MPILNLVAYYILIAVFAGNAASNARGKVFVAGLATMISMLVIARSVPTIAGFVIAYIVGATVSLVALLYWIKVTRPQAIKITGCFIAFNLLLSVLWTVLLNKAA